MLQTCKSQAATNKIMNTDLNMYLNTKRIKNEELQKQTVRDKTSMVFVIWRDDLDLDEKEQINIHKHKLHLKWMFKINLQNWGQRHIPLHPFTISISSTLMNAQPHPTTKPTLNDKLYPNTGLRRLVWHCCPVVMYGSAVLHLVIIDIFRNCK